MFTNRSFTTFLGIITLAAALGASFGANTVVRAQQAGQAALAPQQNGQQSPQSRPPDPARGGPVPAAEFKAPDDIEFRSANVMSEGVRLHAELFSLKSMAGRKLPTVIMAHGWGGVAANFRRDAIDFAKAGYLVITFDYRGWGESDARLILTGPAPIKPISGQNQRFTAEVIEQREYVDPLEQTADWFNVINWAVVEPMVDRDRIGIRGSSFSGSHVFFVAALDSRVKAVVSQVGGGFDPHWVVSDKTQQELTYAEGTKRAHGQAYPAPRSVTLGALVGAPIREKFIRYSPLDEAGKVKDSAVLFIVAEKEELFDNKDNAKLAYDRMPGTKKKYVVLPGITHYGVYRELREQAVKLGIEWFDQYLKK